jgi:hypothetical protein
VNLRILVRSGEVGVCDGVLSGELFPESPPLTEDERRPVSARMSSKLTLRSEVIGATDVSRSSVNLEAVMLDVVQMQT